MVVMKMVSMITKSTMWNISCFTILLMRRFLRGKIVRFVEAMSPYALHGTRGGSTNCHQLGRFVNAPMAFYILILFILALELISSTFFLVFRLFSPFSVYLPLFVRFQLFKRVGDITSQHREVPLEVLGPIIFACSLVVTPEHFINSVTMGIPCMYFTHDALTPVDHYHVLSQVCYAVLPPFPMKSRPKVQPCLYVFQNKRTLISICKLSCLMALGRG